MLNSLRSVLNYLSDNAVLSFFIFIIIVAILGQIYKRFLFKRLKSKFKFLNDKEKGDWFVVLLTGLLFLFIILLLKLFHYPCPLFVWLLCSLSAVVSGTLGLIPYSLSDKKKTK